MRDAQRYWSICFGVHFTSSVGLGALGCLQNKISSALFYSRHSNLLSKLEHLRMGAGKPASFINNQSLVILKFSASCVSRRRV